MIVKSPTESIQVLLDGDVSTAEAQWVASWAEHHGPLRIFRPDSLDGVTSGEAPVPIIPSPADTYQRQPKSITLYNADTAPMGVRFQFVAESTETRDLYRARLEPGEHVEWLPGTGWRVYDEDGILKMRNLEQTAT